MEETIRDLQAQIRRLRALLIALLVGVVGFFAMAQKAEQPVANLDVQRLRLVDADGTVRAVLDSDKDGVAGLRFLHGDATAATIAVMKDGRGSIGVGTSEMRAMLTTVRGPSLLVKGPSGVATLGAERVGPVLRMHLGEHLAVTLGAGGAPPTSSCSLLLDSNAGRSMLLAAEPDYAGVSASGPEGEVRMAVEKRLLGYPALHLREKDVGSRTIRAKD